MTLPVAVTLIALILLAICAISLCARAMIKSGRESAYTDQPLDLPGIALWQAGMDGAVIHSNSVWQDLVAFEDTKGPSWSWADALHPDDQEQGKAAWQKAVASESGFRAELRLFRPDGSAPWALFLGNPHPRRNGGPVVYTCLVIDIDTAKQREVVLGEACEGLRAEACAAKTALASIGHELAAPLNGVIGLAELVLADNRDKNIQAQVQLIADAGQTMKGFLERVSSTRGVASLN